MHNNNNNNINYTDLIKYCKTEKQKEILSLLADGMNQKEVKEELGFSSTGTVGNVVCKIKRYAESAGFLPDGTDYPIPESQCITGISTLYKDGEKSLEWVKTSKRVEDEISAVHTVAETLKDQSLKSFVPEVPKNLIFNDPKLVNTYFLSDYHLGMMAWGEETQDEDWDLKIAKEYLLTWFKTIISLAPDSKVGVFAQLGDFLHWDGISPVTPQSGHVLDVDTRYQKLIRLSIEVITEIINMLLEKHEKVHVLMAEGNHDLAGSAWLREMFSFFYDNNPRVSVDNSAGGYYCYEHGNVSLFFHHGHLKKPEKLDTIFAFKFREIYGRTKYSYAHCGHLHHKKKLRQDESDNLMEVEQHRVLPPKDAYSGKNGFSSDRSSECITYHQNFGEVSRTIVSADMVKELL